MDVQRVFGWRTRPFGGQRRMAAFFFLILLWFRANTTSRAIMDGENYGLSTCDESGTGPGSSQTRDSVETQGRQ